MKRQNGITLIALVISIIVMLILAGVSINAIVGENGVITQTQDATIMTKLASYKEKVEMETVDGQMDGYSISAAKENLKNYLPELTEEEVEEYIIVNDKLIYTGNDERVKRCAEKLDIEVKSKSEADTILVGSIVENIISQSNSDESKYIGEKLLDRDSNNLSTWKLAIDYNSKNEEIGRYGTGWYLLKAGTILSNGSVTLSDFVINYSNNTVQNLYNYKLWSIDSTLGVTENLVLNMDPSILAIGDWETNQDNNELQDLYVNNKKTNISKIGNAYYDSEENALVFDGSKSYIIDSEDADFSNGWTFDYYGKINDLSRTGNYSMLALCHKKCNAADGGMRFGYYRDRVGYTWFGSMSAMRYDMKSKNGIFGNVGSDDFTISTEWADKYFSPGNTIYFSMSLARKSDLTEDKEKYDFINDDEWVLALYVDGEFVDAINVSDAYYQDGLKYWNDSSIPFYIGSCAAGGIDACLNGSLYSCRLYEKGLESSDIKANYDMTLKYRSSF